MKKFNYIHVYEKLYEKIFDYIIFIYIVNYELVCDFPFQANVSGVTRRSV